MKKTIKKIFATILTAVMAMSVGMPAFAEDNVDVIPETMVSYLTDEAGNVTVLEGTLVETPILLSDGEYSATYEYEVATSALDNDKTTTGTDNSVSVRARTTIHYQTQNSPTEYKLTAVEGYWTILDNSVSVTNSSLTYVCRNLLSGRGQYNSISNVNNNFYYATGFGTFIPQIDG